MAKNLVLAQIWAPKCFFVDFTFIRCQTLLQAIIACNFKQNYRTKLEKMAENLVLGLILALLPQIWDPKLFSWILLLLDVRHYCKLSLHAISRKTNEPNLRKWQKTQFWAQFWPLWPKFGSQNFFPYILPLSDVRNCRKLSLYAISQKNNQLNLRKWQKTYFRTRFWTIWPKFGPPKLFFKNLAPLVTICHGQLSTRSTISEKSNDPILRKLSYGRTNGRTVGKTDERVISQDPVRPTLERPKRKNSFLAILRPKAIVKDSPNKLFESILSLYAVVASWKISDNFGTVVFRSTWKISFWAKKTVTT